MTDDELKARSDQAIQNTIDAVVGQPKPVVLARLREEFLTAGVDPGRQVKVLAGWIAGATRM